MVLQLKFVIRVEKQITDECKHIKDMINYLNGIYWNSISELHDKMNITKNNST